MRGASRDGSGPRAASSHTHAHTHTHTHTALRRREPNRATRRDATAEALATRYGKAKVAGWQFRVGTEPNCECHWEDGAAAYMRVYAAVDRAVRTVLGPETWVGPGNFARESYGVVDYVVEVRTPF